MRNQGVATILIVMRMEPTVFAALTFSRPQQLSDAGFDVPLGAELAADVLRDAGDAAQLVQDRVLADAVPILTAEVSTGEIASAKRSKQNLPE